MFLSESVGKNAGKRRHRKIFISSEYLVWVVQYDLENVRKLVVGKISQKYISKTTISFVCLIRPSCQQMVFKKWVTFRL